ncbi:MAG: isopenicillin N synthase family dioxygenase [Acidimicrobiales bacterium]
MNEIPVVDMSNPTGMSVTLLDSACRDHGFFLLEGHGLEDLVQHMWDQTERFFDSDQEVREGVRREGTSPFGYNDRELTKRKRDNKQVFDYGSSLDERIASLNRWPEGLPGFRTVLEEFHHSFSELALRTLELLHDALSLSDLGRQTVTGSADKSFVRLNHYPVGDSVPSAERDGLADLGPTALGYHTDPGVLTLLLQDDVGGLQARTRSGEWIDVAPRPNTIVVNLADVMQVWTNDRYLAAVHRVVPMTSVRRFSIPLFFSPVRGAMIEPLPELCEGPAQYRAFAWRDFMQARNDDNLHDAGAADTQISDYLVR